jgi:hypothetical protein
MMLQKCKNVAHGSDMTHLSMQDDLPQGWMQMKSHNSVQVAMVPL